MKHSKKIIIVGLIVITAIFGLLLIIPRTQPEPIKNEPIKMTTNVKSSDDTLTLDMKPLGQYGQTGKIEFVPIYGAKTEVNLSLNEATTSAQPVYLHFGTCDKIGELQQPLVYALNGRSQSLIADSIEDLIEQKLIVVVHKRINNFNNPGAFASCAEIRK